MPRSTKPSQKKAKRRKAENHESAQPSSKKVKIVPLAEPIAVNLQSRGSLLHNAAVPNMARRSNQPSIPLRQLQHPQQMFVPSGVRPPRFPIMNLHSHPIPGPPNVRPGLRPQIIPGNFYGPNIRQPPVLLRSNFIPRSSFPVANARPAFGMNVPPTFQLPNNSVPMPIKEKPTAAKSVERYYRCTECLERFSTMTKLEDHRRIHREKPKGMRIQCSSLKCQGLFKDFDELDRHFKEHHIQLDLACDFCGQKFINHCDLNDHKKRHD